MLGMPELMTAQTVLCFDFGMRKIGVAIGQSVTKTARPLQNIKATDGIPNWDLIANLIAEWTADALVVGLPYNMDGSEQTITLAARKFARRLEAKFHLPVHMKDERLSTKEALAQLQAKNDKKTEVDSYAAALILESWLREQHNG